jgi:hypothetical protein
MNVIGGCAFTNNSETALINESGPTPLRNGWLVVGYPGGEPGVAVTVTAICTPVAAPAG